MDYTSIVRCPHCQGCLERTGRHSACCSDCDRRFVVVTEADGSGVRITLIDARQGSPTNPA